MKTVYKHFVLLVTILSFSSLARPQNLLVDTNFTTDPGSGGAPASCIFTGGTVYGFTIANATFRLADDFYVPPGLTWQLDSLVFYAYQTNSGNTSTMTGGFVKIWQGRPDSTGAVLVFGDATTNRMTQTGWTGIYRVTETALTNTARPIMYLRCTIGTTLPSGYYWFEVGATGSSASGPFSPPKVLPGRLNPPGQNAKQYTVSTMTYANMLDVSTICGMNVILRGTSFVGIGNNNQSPMKYSLDQNYPNPFNPMTKIEFELAKAGQTKLSVFNSLGQVVRTLVDREMASGPYSVTFDASDLPSGVYVYKIESGDFVESRKMMLVK